ncbi:MAG: MCE family protein, partial [Proteobacteria bacterium]|nr:MCE family protein [Pseudomonadota bacterium]
ENQDAVKNSLQNVETFTASLARNAGKIDDVVQKFNEVMVKADGVMTKTDDLMLGLDAIAGGKGGGELLQAVKSIRDLADDFNKRSGALMTDGRRTLADISRAVNNLDRNPTRLLFGASSSSNSSASAPAQAAPAPPRRR